MCALVFNFLHYIYNCSVVLFFAIVLSIASLVFFGKRLTFALFVLQALAGATFSSLVGFCRFACMYLLFQMLVFAMFLPSLALCRVFVLF